MVMIKNIVFDIGNVLVSFQPEPYFVQHFMDAGKTSHLCQQVFAQDTWREFDRGTYQIEDVRAVYHNQYPQDQEDIDFILDHWVHLMAVKEDTYLYLLDLKKRGYRIYLLSNISEDGLHYVFANMALRDVIDGGVYSYEEKSIKPEVEIFERLMSKYHLVAKETLFLDDCEANILQAHALGMHGVVFRDLQEVKKEVRQIEEREAQC